MKLITVETSTHLHKMSLDALSSFVLETATNLKAIQSLHSCLFTTSEAIEKGMDVESVPDDILDEIEIAEMELSMEMLSEYFQGLCAPTQVLARRAENAHGYMEPLIQAIKEFSETMVRLTDKQVVDLRTLLERALAELSFLLYYGFYVNLTAQSINEGAELAVTYPIKAYLDTTGQSAEHFCGFMKELIGMYKPELSIFDAFPALEAEFYSAVGSSLPDFELYADFISSDLILGVIEGKIEVEEAIKQLQQMSVGQEQ